LFQAPEALENRRVDNRKQLLIELDESMNWVIDESIHGIKSVVVIENICEELKMGKGRSWPKNKWSFRKQQLVYLFQSYPTCQ